MGSPKGIEIQFPSEIYKYLVRKTNSALRERFIDVSFPFLKIRFLEINRKGRWDIVDWLYSEISKRLVKIVQKYELEVEKDFRRKTIRSDYKVEKSFREIHIIGYYKIPPRSISHILSICIWTYVIFTFNVKPPENEETKKMADKYEEEAERYIKYLNSKPREKVSLNIPRKCIISCGEEAFSYNKWYYQKDGTSKTIYTPICKKHKDYLV